MALAAAGWLTYVAIDRAAHDRQQTRRLRELFGTVSDPALMNRLPEPARPAALAARPPRSGDPIGRLEIPGAGISLIVAAGTDALTLRRGVGHIDGTALPGEPGNVGLAGHRDTVFRRLEELKLADPISLVTARGSFDYSVESLQTVAPERIGVLDASSYSTVTLVTCYPFDFIGPAPLRYVVRAREVGRSPPALDSRGLHGSEPPRRP